MHAYQVAVKDARIAFFVSLVAEHHHNPTVLFRIITRVIKPSSHSELQRRPTRCEEFLTYFYSMVTDIRASQLWLSLLYPQSHQFSLILKPSLSQS